MAIIFLTIFILNFKTEKTLSANNIVTGLDSKISDHPVLLDNYFVPFISGKAAIVLESDSQTILFSKNPDLRFSTASTAKIMTALVAIDYYKKDTILTIKSPRTEGTGLGFHFGDRFYFEELLYAMMLPSANDAAAAIADNYPGGRAEFVAKMNEKAQNFHLTDSHFTDSIGIDDDGNYSTVVDMARLGSIAMENQYFANVVSTRDRIISNVNRSNLYPASNLNKLLGINGVDGIKTGTTEGAGEVLVTSTMINNHRFIIVTMNSEDRFGDTNSLLNFIINNVRFEKIR